MTPAEVLAKKKAKIKRKQRMDTRIIVFRCYIKEYRERLGLSHTDVANATGLMDIKHIESGKNIYLTNAMKIAKFFGVTVEELWTPNGLASRTKRRNKKS